ncbi:MAG: hypothetical protein AAF944_11730 [Bacteroidota bacterium]
MNTAKLCVSVFFMLIFSCSEGENSAEDEVPAELTKVQDTPFFELRTPLDWTLEVGQGFDTYVGHFIGPEDEIFFDQGISSFGTLHNIREDDNTLSFEKTRVNGIPTVITKRNENDSVILFAYFDANDKVRLNKLYSIDPGDEDLVIKIFRTHQFK